GIALKERLDFEDARPPVPLLERAHFVAQFSALLSRPRLIRNKFSPRSIMGADFALASAISPGTIRVVNGGFVTLRLLHFADLHLARSFASERLYGVRAQRRRGDLRAALQRIVERASQAKVDLITCAGDLFEHDHVTR